MQQVKWKADRRHRFQQPISWNKNQQEVGKVVDVLIEQQNPETGELIGRSGRFSPEVDGQVYVKQDTGEDGFRRNHVSAGEAKLGEIFPVAIHSADTYDLYGQVVNTNKLSVG